MKKKYLIIIGVVLILIGVVGLSYSFFSKGGKQELANTFKSGCLNITITDESSSLNLKSQYPVSDVEGLQKDNYSFTITNECDTKASFDINIESLETSDKIDPEHIKVALSSNTNDNIITKLTSDKVTTNYIANSYTSHNIYKGTIEGKGTKTFYLKEWIDYDTTTTEGANKTYESKINVVATDSEYKDNLEVKYEKNESNLIGTTSEGVTSATYCLTNKNECVPNLPVEVEANKINIKLQSKSGNQMVCTKLNDQEEIICSNPFKNSYCPDGATSCESIMANIETIEDIGNEFAQDSEVGPAEVSNKKLYVTEDDFGQSYYYRGAVEDNYVYFGGYYWRIIRINGDGSIRMIYDGTTPHDNGEGSEDRQIGKSVYSDYQCLDDDCSIQSDGAAQFRYGEDELGNGIHGTIFPSYILGADEDPEEGTLNWWYKTNIVDKNLDKYINVNSTFCNDRITASVWTDWKTWLADGAVDANTYDYNTSGPGMRIKYSDPMTPILKCYDSRDLFSKVGASKGNQSLKYPVGLITADEVLFAGGFLENNYLFSGEYFWTMSPYGFVPTREVVGVYIDVGVGLNYYVSSERAAVRPVINLKANLNLSGNGTKDKPYEVV